MSMTVDQLVSQARQLSPALRAELLDRLAVELHGEVLPQIEAEWNRVALERAAAVESGHSQTRAGDEVMARMRRLIGR